MTSNVSFGNGQSLRPFSACVAAFTAALLLLAFAPHSRAATTLLGQPYDPAGKNYTITALQGIITSVPQGTSTGAQVNTGVEFTGGIGVTFINPSKYTVSSASTGLKLTYDFLVTGNGQTLTLGDFDVYKNSNLFDPSAVAPTITLFGAGGTSYGTLTAAQIKPWMSYQADLTSVYKSDIWNVNVGGLLSTLNLSQTSAISGITLAAATIAPNKNKVLTNMSVEYSDPYFLVGSTAGYIVPEQGSALLVLGAAVGALLITRRRDMR